MQGCLKFHFSSPTRSWVPQDGNPTYPLPFDRRPALRGDEMSPAGAMSQTHGNVQHSSIRLSPRLYLAPSYLDAQLSECSHGLWCSCCLLVPRCEPLPGADSSLVVKNVQVCPLVSRRVWFEGSHPPTPTMTPEAQASRSVPDLTPSRSVQLLPAIADVSRSCRSWKSFLFVRLVRDFHDLRCVAALVR